MINFFSAYIKSQTISAKSFKLFKLLISIYLFQEFCWLFASREQLLFESGFNPTSIAIKLLEFGQFSIFNLYPDALFINAVIGLGFVLIIGINFSRFSKISAFLLWLILNQIHTRNLSIFTNSHSLVQIFILFILFYRPSSKNNFLGWSITIFISSIFFHTTYLRDFQSWFYSGDHLYYLMSDEYRSSLLSHVMLQTLRLYRPLSLLIYSIEFIGGFLIFFSFGRIKNFSLIFMIFFEIITNLFFKNYAYTYLVVSALILLINFDKINLKYKDESSLVNNSLILFTIISIGMMNIIHIFPNYNNNFFKVWTSSVAIRPYWKTIKEDYNLNKWYRILAKTTDHQYLDKLSSSGADYFESHIPDKDSQYKSNHMIKNYFDNIERFHFNSKLQGAFYRPILKYFCTNKTEEVSIIKIEKVIPQLGKKNIEENQVQNFKETTLAKMGCSN